MKARLYASMTQAAPATAKPRSFAMPGMATTTAVTSNSVRNVPRPSASVIRFDRPCAIWDARLCMSSPLLQGLRVGQRSAARSTSMDNSRGRSGAPGFNTRPFSVRTVLTRQLHQDGAVGPPGVSQGSIAFPNKPNRLIDLDQRPKDTKCMVEP